MQPGRGEYAREITSRFPETIVTAARSRLDDILIPYRTVHAIWIADRFISLTQAEAFTELNTCWDWLLPEGVAYLCVMEGEGNKILKDAASREGSAKLITYYQPAELENLLSQASFRVLDAWRELIAEKPYIHVLIQRPNPYVSDTANN